MKDIQRYALIAAIVVVLFLLLLEWKDFAALRDKQANIPQETLTTNGSAYIDNTADGSNNFNGDRNLDKNTSASDDDIPSANESSAQRVPEKAPLSNHLINVETDVLQLKIDPLGGDIVMASLPSHWAALDTPEIPFNLLNRTSDRLYVAQSGLIGKNGTDKSGQRPLFSVDKNNFVLTENQKELRVDLTLPTENGISITKRFTFFPGEYLINITYLINNQSRESWQASFFGQIKRDSYKPKSTATGMQPFLGAATTTVEERYLKMDFDDIADAAHKEKITGGWVAFVQHYFISAWVGNAEEENSYRIKKLNNRSGNNDLYIMGYTGPLHQVAANSSGEINSQFYIGPKITEHLEEISPYLDLTVDYGWLWWVAKPINWTLKTIHGFVPNWGWSIVLLTICIKALLFPLSNKAYISMGHMRKVAPKMASIKERCGDNRQKLQEEMMKLYKTEKINPLGGCLPMLLQMPVFISLYWVLMESVELRHAPFMAWITDLSVMDPYFVLPLIMGLSMFLQQKMNPTPPDPMQAKVMQFLPVIFTFMFLWFPAGLVLYWVVNNITSMVHQGYVNKRVESGQL